MNNKMNNLLLGGIVSHTERARIHAMNSPLGRAKMGIPHREGGGGGGPEPHVDEPGSWTHPNPNASIGEILEHKTKTLKKLVEERGNKGEMAVKEKGNKVKRGVVRSLKKGQEIIGKGGRSAAGLLTEGASLLIDHE